jgi:hypothetical protein
MIYASNYGCLSDNSDADEFETNCDKSLQQQSQQQRQQPTTASSTVYRDLATWTGIDSDQENNPECDNEDDWDGDGSVMLCQSAFCPKTKTTETAKETLHDSCGTSTASKVASVGRINSEDDSDELNSEEQKREKLLFVLLSFLLFRCG